MRIIDAHQHFWKYDPHKHEWINDEMSVLKKDFLGEDLRSVFQQNDIAGSIAVQADQSEEETHFLIELASQHDYIKGVVGWIDLRSPTVSERLQYFSQFPIVKGFRHVVQDEPDVNFMLGEAFQNGIAALQAHGFTYDILIFPSQLEAALQLVRNFPQQPFVIDHIAKPSIKKGSITPWAKYITAIAEHKNVYCKVSGMVTEADWQQWNYKDFVPYLDVVFGAFGTERILYGSDYPVCLLAASYKNVKGILHQYLQGFSKEDQDNIWYKNAMRFYRFN
ncbi:MAG: amidohydrolase family protein [Bacteroidota bacterium]